MAKSGAKGQRAPRKDATSSSGLSVPAYHAQLATLVDKPPEGDQWLHEIKLDGYRIGARVDGKSVELWSRNGKDWTQDFPEIQAAVQQLKCKAALLDGEIVILLEDGRSSFQVLQNAFKGGARHNLYYFVFDLLYLDGVDTSKLPLEQRKEKLRVLLAKSKGHERIRYTDHVVGEGQRVFEHACKMSMEGIVSKRRDRPYEARRSSSWQKVKCVLRQEFVIAGFTDPEGSRVGIGALLLGYYDGPKLIFAGKVGTGFSIKTAREIRAMLDKLEQADCPYAVRPPGLLGRKPHWVRPELVGEVVFSEWTSDGSLRHPSFQGLRKDKNARQVRKELPQSRGRSER